MTNSNLLIFSPAWLSHDPGEARQAEITLRVSLGLRTESLAAIFIPAIQLELGKIAGGPLVSLTQHNGVVENTGQIPQTVESRAEDTFSCHSHLHFVRKPCQCCLQNVPSLLVQTIPLSLHLPVSTQNQLQSMSTQQLLWSLKTLNLDVTQSSQPSKCFP